MTCVVTTKLGDRCKNKKYANGEECYIHQECSLCYEYLCTSTKFECGHRIHMKCVKKLLSDKCPLCRSQLKPLSDDVITIIESNNRAYQRELEEEQFQSLLTEIDNQISTQYGPNHSTNDYSTNMFFVSDSPLCRNCIEADEDTNRIIIVRVAHHQTT